jgi:hypothetical protein
MSNGAVTAPPSLNIKPRTRLATGLPNFLTFTAFAVGFVGALAGISMLSGIGMASPLPGIFVLIGSIWSGISIFAFADVVLSLRKIAFNTEK